MKFGFSALEWPSSFLSYFIAFASLLFATL